MEERTVGEKKTLSLIELRNYKLTKREEKNNIIEFHVKLPSKKKGVILCISKVKVVGVAYIRKLAKMVEEKDIEKGIIVANTRYTWAARREARKNHIELIPRRFPPFNIFKHKLVPDHTILPPKEAEKILKKYHIESHQLPRIKSSDVAVIAIGARPGNIIKITRKSPTAGEHVSYRLVVIDPQAKIKL